MALNYMKHCCRQESVSEAFSSVMFIGGPISIKDGIAYISVGSTFCQLNYWPNEQEVNFDEEHPPCFNFVTLLADRMIVKEHSVSLNGLNVADKT